MFGWFGRKATYWKNAYDELRMRNNELTAKLGTEQQRRRAADRKALAQDFTLMDLRDQVQRLRKQNYDLLCQLGKPLPETVTPQPKVAQVARFTRDMAQPQAVKEAERYDETRSALVQHSLDNAVLADLAFLGAHSGNPITQPAPLDEPFRSGGGGDFGGAGASASWDSSDSGASSSSDYSSSCDSSSSDSSSSCSASD